MNFLKWFTFLLASGLFIWYVFFRSPSTNIDGEDNIVENVGQGDDTTTDDFENNDEASNDEGFLDETSGDESSDESYVSEETPVVEDPPVVEQEVSSSTGFDWNQKYFIVVGSFGSKNNAKKMKKRVIDDGRNAEIKYINNLHRVIVETTDDRTNARQVRDHFTQIYKEQAFILEN